MRRKLLLSLLVVVGVLWIARPWLFPQPNNDPTLRVSTMWTGDDTVTINTQGEIVVKVEPCETVTPVADFRDLLQPGFNYGGINQYIVGHPPLFSNPGLLLYAHTTRTGHGGL